MSVGNKWFIVKFNWNEKLVLIPSKDTRLKFSNCQIYTQPFESKSKAIKYLNKNNLKYVMYKNCYRSIK